MDTKPLVKRLNFASTDKTGEPVVRIIPGDHLKMAHQMHPDMATWLGENDRPADVLRVLVTALGAFEGYGANLNGDGFHEKHLCAVPDNVYLQAQPYEKPIYRTFEDFARLYRSHQNRPHNRAYGNIPFTLYNRKMRRVEAIIDIITGLDENQEVLDDVDRGVFPSVSMGFRCFVAGTMIQADRGAVPIEEIQVGDLVWTHRGRLRMVTQLFRNDPPEELIAVRATGDYKTSRPTPNHEYYAIRRDDILTEAGHVSHAKCRKIDPEWLCIEHLNEGDYLLELAGEPSAAPVDYPMDTATAYLLGVYVGDGSVYDANRYGKSVRSVSIECDAAHPAIYEKITRTCQQKQWNYSVTYTHSNTVRVTIRETKFGTLARQLFGDGSKEKFIASSVYNWTDEEKFAFLGGYLDADGTFDGSGRITSVNENLMQQTKQLAWSAGLAVTLHRDPIGNTKGGFAGTSGFGYILSLSKPPMSQIAPYTAKVPTDYDFGVVQSGGDNFIKKIDGKRYIAKRIRHLERVPNFVQTVYNFAVDEDESYVADGNIVHNCVPGDICSICQNYARPFASRRHYCNHLRNGMLRYHKSGRLIYAINHNGYFFDLSIVSKPADRIAFGMRKIAMPVGIDIAAQVEAAEPDTFVEYSSKTAEVDGSLEIIESIEQAPEEPPKAADHSKEIPAEIQDVVKDNPDPEFKSKGYKVVLYTDQPMEAGLLNRIALQYTLPEIMATMAGMGVIPSPQEFQRLVLVANGEKKTADALDRAGITFDPSDTREPENAALDITAPGHRMNAKLAHELAYTGVVDARSYYPPFLAHRAGLIKHALDIGDFFDQYPLRERPTPRRRVNIEEIFGAEPAGAAVPRPEPEAPLVMGSDRYIPSRPKDVTVRHKSNVLLPLAALAALYSGARFISTQAKKGPLSRQIFENPLVAAGAFGGTAGLSWLASRLGLGRKKKEAASREQVARWAGDYMLHLLAGLGLGYGLAARAERKRDLGVQPNLLEEGYERHPLFGSLVTAMATGGAGRALGRVIKRGSTEISSDVERVEKLATFEPGLLGEYPMDYLDKVARRSLNRSWERIRDLRVHH